MSEEDDWKWCETCHCSHYNGECPESRKFLTGGSVEYYRVTIDKPTSGGPAYVAECNDIIEALNMTYAEGNAFKAVWRHALARQGKGKEGNTALYDAEKIEFFGRRLVDLWT